MTFILAHLAAFAFGAAIALVIIRFVPDESAF